MKRSEHLVRIILDSLRDGSLCRWQVTNKIKNYEREAREEAIATIVENGYVSFSDAPMKPGRGRNAVVISITPRGISRLESLDGQFKDVSVWSK